MIDGAGDGLGNTLNNPFGLAATSDGDVGDVYVTGLFSSNAFKISTVTPVPALGRAGLVLLAAILVGSLVWLRPGDRVVNA